MGIKILMWVLWWIIDLVNFKKVGMFFEEDINFCMNVGMIEWKLGRMEGFFCC